MRRRRCPSCRRPRGGAMAEEPAWPRPSVVDEVAHAYNVPGKRLVLLQRLSDAVLKLRAADPALTKPLCIVVQFAGSVVPDGDFDRLSEGEFHSLVNPGTSIPPFIQVLTGITDAMVAASPTVAAM